MSKKKKQATERLARTRGASSLQGVVLRHLADDVELMEVGRKAVEDALVEWRDSRMFQVRNNGLTIQERDGSPSDIVRFGPEVGMAIALRAIAEHLETKAQNGPDQRLRP